MQFSTVLATLGLVAVAAAQTSGSTSTTSSSPSSSDCDAQYIVDTCLSNIKDEPECASQDYRCLCDRAARSVTCWDNCPKNQEVGIQKSEETSWCNAWKQSPGYASQVSAASEYAATATTSSSSPSNTAGSSASPSASSEASEENNDSGAGVVVVSGAGVVGAMIAAVGMLL